MKSALLPLALLALLSASSARAEALRCEDGRVPVLTGNPFRPTACPPGGKLPDLPDVALSTADVPAGGKTGDLDSLDGHWRGLCYFAATRYECELTVSDGGKRATWLAMDYHTHLGEELDVQLVKPGWFSRGQPKLVVTSPHLPGVKLSGRAWLAPGAAACKFDGRPQVHRVEYKRQGDRLDVTYTDFEPKYGPVTVSFSLDRVGD